MSCRTRIPHSVIILSDVILSQRLIYNYEHYEVEYVDDKYYIDYDYELRYRNYIDKIKNCT